MPIKSEKRKATHLMMCNLLVDLYIEIEGKGADRRLFVLMVKKFVLVFLIILANVGSALAQPSFEYMGIQKGEAEAAALSRFRNQNISPKLEKEFHQAKLYSFETVVSGTSCFGEMSLLNKVVAEIILSCPFKDKQSLDQFYATVGRFFKDKYGTPQASLGRVSYQGHPYSSIIWKGAEKNATLSLAKVVDQERKSVAVGIMYHFDIIMAEMAESRLK